ncbi:cytochrome b [Actinophytocola glycyrrhizae]|uniref:Cytochrome bc1 complex cytochrome b subunit n=1 Tax=Actinophytocola glycyrrhizae TaxID=2044873 RepID=A0ABV9SFE5_9PSEU
MIVRRLVRGLDSRLRLAGSGRKALAKIFPDHWTFMFGEIALYAFMVLVLTGTFLALFFEPSTAETVYRGAHEPLDGERVSAAFSSTVALSFDVRAGLLMRQTHHWAALVFVAAIVLHLARVFFTGAFRKPREINWLVGVTMLMLALLNGFTGYSMPDDLLSGTGLRIGYSVLQSVPLAGPWLAALAFGGEFPAEQTVPRLFATHVFVVPALLAGLVVLHMLILVRQKHSQFPGRGRTEHNVVGSRFWPAYTVRTLALFAAVLAVLFGLGGLFQINPVWIYGPFDPAQVTSPAQPDWYIAWGEGALRLFPAADFQIFGHLVPSPFVPGIVLGGLTFLGLYAVPFVEAWSRRDRQPRQLLDRPRDHPVRIGVGVAALTFYGVLLAAASDDLVARALAVPIVTVVWVFRVLVLVLPPVTGLVAIVLARAMRGTTGGFTDLTMADVRRALRGRGEETPQEAEPPARPDAARLELVPVPGRAWRWRYVEPGEDGEPFVLTSHIEYPDQDAARSAARTGYPDVPFLADEEPAEPARAEQEPQERADTPGRGRTGPLTAAVLWLTRRRGQVSTAAGRGGTRKTPETDQDAVTVNKRKVRELLDEGLGYDEIGQRFGITPGLAYLIGTGRPADGGDAPSQEQRRRDGDRAASQELSNPPFENPTKREPVQRWIADRVTMDPQMRSTRSRDE